MAKRKAVVIQRPRLKVRAWNLLHRAVEEGLRYGLNRTQKYALAPTDQGFLVHFEDAVMHEIAEVFDFD